MNNSKSAVRMVERRHLGHFGAHRGLAGWVAYTSGTGAARDQPDLFIPLEALRLLPSGSLEACVTKVVQDALTALHGARRISSSEAFRLVRGLKEMGVWGPMRRRTLRDICKGNSWNLRSTRRLHCGVSYSVERSRRGWLVWLSTIWGDSRGTYLVPFRAVRRGGKNWDIRLLPAAIRRYLASLEGTREITFAEEGHLFGWDKHGSHVNRKSTRRSRESPMRARKAA
jgi:hypothetical protein